MLPVRLALELISKIWVICGDRALNWHQSIRGQDIIGRLSSHLPERPGCKGWMVETVELELKTTNHSQNWSPPKSGTEFSTQRKIPQRSIRRLAETELEGLAKRESPIPARLSSDYQEWDGLRRTNGGRTRARTWDPMIKSHLLYQLSYAPGTCPREGPSQEGVV